MRSTALATVVAVGVALLGITGCSGRDPAPGPGAPRVVLKTTAGEITVELFPDMAPVSVQNFLDYVDAGYYDGTIFHRVIPNFMIQGGGLTKDLGEKREGQRPPITNEAGNGLRNSTGTLAMARTADPESAQSQFFINLTDNRFLDRDRAADKVGYAVFGKVVAGMETVHAIAGVRTVARGLQRDVPAEPITLNSARRAP